MRRLLRDRSSILYLYETASAPVVPGSNDEGAEDEEEEDDEDEHDEWEEEGEEDGDDDEYVFAEAEDDVEEACGGEGRDEAGGSFGGVTHKGKERAEDGYN